MEYVGEGVILIVTGALVARPLVVREVVTLTVGN